MKISIFCCIIGNHSIGLKEMYCKNIRKGLKIMMRLFFKKKVLLKGEILTVSKLWRLIGLLHVVRDRVFSYQHSALFLGDNFRLTIFRNISKLHVTNRYKGNSYCLLLESVFCGRMCHFINWTVYPSRNQNKNSKNQAWMWPNKMWYSPKNLTFL